MDLREFYKLYNYIEEKGIQNVNLQDKNLHNEYPSLTNEDFVICHYLVVADKVVSEKYIKDQQRDTPLTTCVNRDNKNLLKYFIDRNVNISKEDKEDYVPLDYDLRNNNRNIINSFINQNNYLNSFKKSIQLLLKGSSPSFKIGDVIW
ncbi:hypothetical protein PIROE2DRAFT_59797 [Piromyces sp. E2]|nr:hypothetical protein PIROE2DRAFT_59797 [Piromyces sp. E2]|eukprot:OUM65741.1 hypothetical protein PIROE2DRAFT_59797 [Piromyces sp. E2]